MTTRRSLKNYCTLYLVRHGETEWNKNRTVLGQMDSALTPHGIAQVRATAEELKDVRFDAIFSSDSARAQRTAEIMRLDRDLAIQTSELLRERKYGRFEGSPSTEFYEATRDLLVEKEKLTEQEQWKFRFGEDMESDEDLVSRFIVQLREIAVSYPDKTVLISTHGGCIRMFLVRAGYAEYGKLRYFQNAGYAKVISDGVDFMIETAKGAGGPSEDTA